MEIVLAVGLVAVAVLGATALARRLGLPAPAVLLLLGVGVSYLPVQAVPELSPELVLVGLLPPLLYAAASNTSLLDFRRNASPIGWLSVGLVLFTAAGVGVVLWWLLDIPYAAAFAVGAVVAPPDAVAATAVARQIGLPRRVVTILEGESLVNDATALVSLRSAVNALGAPVAFAAVLLDFGRAVGLGVLVGLVGAKAVAFVMSRTTDTMTSVTLTFLAPFLVYVPAEVMHGSGVLAVVVCGLILGHVAPAVSTPSARVSGRLTWATLQFLLENAVFFLIGLQVRHIVAASGESGLSPARVLAAAGATSLAVIVLRFAWVFLSRLFGTIGLRSSARGRPLPRAEAAVIGWAGMRGVVTLAAALSLPPNFPHRAPLILVAMVVTAGTLLLNGLTLPWVARRGGVRGPDAREDALQEAVVLHRTVRAGLAVVDEQATGWDSDVVGRLREGAETRVNAAWERLGTHDPDRPTPTERYRRLRSEALHAEREELLRIRSEGTVDHEVLAGVLGRLDVEESILSAVVDRDVVSPDAPSLPGAADGACEHLAAAPTCVRPTSTGGCPACLAEGLAWVHLRMCLTCGAVGCCDSSPGRHADRHFRDTGHPVIRSIEPGEHWRWCFVDETLGAADSD